MRYFIILCLLIGHSANASDTYSRFLEQTGIADILQQFPNDILSAANRHAARCQSTAQSHTPDAQRLFDVLVGRLALKVPRDATQQLVDWYESPTGLKVRELERNDIDETALREFAVNSRRASRFQQIYNNTQTGPLLAAVAVELEYAGWALSGCKQKAEQSGDVKKLHWEVTHGQVIKKEAQSLEQILRADTLHSMAFLMSQLSDPELTEYALVTTKHADIYAELMQSLINTIEIETSEMIAISGY